MFEISVQLTIYFQRDLQWKLLSNLMSWLKNTSTHQTDSKGEKNEMWSHTHPTSTNAPLTSSATPQCPQLWTHSFHTGTETVLSCEMWREKVAEPGKQTPSWRGASIRGEAGDLLEIADGGVATHIVLFLDVFKF